MSPLVRINFDSAEKISELFGIGPALAAKVVEHRNKAGYFHDPTDLDKVDGISLHLAETLSPHIDWSVPTSDVPPQKLGISHYIASAVLILLCLSGITYKLYLYIIFLSEPVPLVNKVISSIGMIMLVSILLLLLLMAMTLDFVDSTSNLDRKKKGYRIAYVCIVWSASLYFIYAVVLLIHEDVATVEGWRTLLSSKTRVLTYVTLPAFLMMIGPALLAIKAPQYLHRPVLHRAYDFLLLAYPLIGNLILWIGDYAHSTRPSARAEILILYVGSVVIAVVLVFCTLASYLKNQPLFLLVAEMTGAGAAANYIRDEHWLRWLNARLPDVEQQKLLQQALANAYPSSRFRTAMSLAIVGASVWLLLTSLGAVIEWIIQKRMDSLVK